MSAKKRRAKQRARIIIFLVELLVIVAMLIAVLKVFQTTDEVEGPHFAQIDESQIVVNSEVVEKFGEIFAFCKSVNTHKKLVVLGAPCLL